MYNGQNNYYSPHSFNILPPVCKNLLIINVILYLLTIVLKAYHIDLTTAFGLHFFLASKFHIWQLITYAFLHGSFSHLFFNMFALWMFGYTIENIWGSKRFLLYCLVACLGAALMQELTYFFMYKDLIFGGYTSVNLNGVSLVSTETFLNSLNTIGASGICFGVLLAFGMMFPNEYIYLYFLVPIKCKWFIIGYCAIELLNGVATTGDGVAHFAHLGGALAGLILILLWRKKTNI
jgi:membrane associated rhomboid family serine protease